MKITETIEYMDKDYIRSFMRIASLLKDNKIPFDKRFLRSFDPQLEGYYLAEQILGKEFLYLQDEAGFRLYVKDVFGDEGLNLFEDSEGSYRLDVEHALLFYYTMQAKDHPELEKAKGLVYWLLGNRLKEEFDAIAKLAPKNRVTPIFELSAQSFRWRRCNYVLRKYMLPMGVVDEGYNAFYFEKANLAHIFYLVHHGQSFTEANATVKELETGIFYRELPKHVEGVLLPAILSGEFNTDYMTGEYKNVLLQDIEDLSREYRPNEVYNVYNMAVKPRMVEYMGKVIGMIEDELLKTLNVSASEYMVYHISPVRMGVFVKDTLALKDLLPSLHTFFKPVEPMDFETVLEGTFI